MCNIIHILVAATVTIAGCSSVDKRADAGGASDAALDALDLGAPPDLTPCTPRQRFDASGYFRVEQDCGRWWFVTPTGERFYSFGVNHVRWDGDVGKSGANPYADAVATRYGSEEDWARATADRLTDWGWNTVGSWSSYTSLGQLMPYTVMLTLSQADPVSGALPDYFTDEWAAGVTRLAAPAGELQDDPRLVGYFLDNELHWGPDWRSGRDLFEEFLRRDAASAGKQALIALLRSRYGGDIARFNAAWHTTLASFDALASLTKLGARGTSPEADADRSAFIEAVAERFFSVTVQAVHAVDPHHLVLGVRLVASLTPREVAEAAARWVDVISVNSYEYTLDPQTVFRPDRNGFVDLSTGGFLEAFYRTGGPTTGGRPVLVTEFGFRAKDSGLPNTMPPFYPTLATQAERADRFEAYARRCQTAPWIIGYHWYEYTDQPAEGRKSDGEDNNWGLVDVKDDPYATLVERSQTVNRPPAP